MQGLIRIEERDGEQVVSARELHEFLEVKSEFPKWARRMFDYGFEESVDYSTVTSKNDDNLRGGRKTLIDYALTLDTAKEIAMLQRSEKGKQARRYFIQCEKQLRESAKALTPAELLLENAKRLVENEKQMAKLDQRMSLVEAKTTTRPDYFTIAGYAVVTGVRVNLSLAGALGKKAKIICQQRNIPVDAVRDPRFGKVGSYPEDVLQEVFESTVMK